MKKILKLTLAVALMMCATVASAQKFGRVDLAAIVPNMPEFKEAQTNLEAYGLDLQNQLEQIQVEFNQKYAEYEKNRATYTDTIRQMKESELQQLQQRFQEFQQIAQQDIQQKEAELMEPIYNKANEAGRASIRKIVLRPFRAVKCLLGDVANLIQPLQMLRSTCKTPIRFLKLWSQSMVFISYN